MSINMGTVDRLIRATAAVIVGVLYLMGTLSGLTATILGIIALILLATSAVGTCPLYLPFGLSTRSKQSGA